LSEITKFVAAAPGKKYAELWLVVNGAVDAAPNAKRVMDSHKITHVNLRAEIQKQISALVPDSDEDSPPTSTASGIETRDAMQDEAVRISCERLRELAAGRGDSRGRIILPCGTGKSRVALRIIEQLTEPGQAAAILCPSIALVAQLRGEFLMNSDRKIAALAVCSDQTAAQGSDLSVDQTADLSQTSARDVKGRVTTDADEISEWIKRVPADRIGVIFGTYQSSFKIGEALTSGSHRLAVLVADEAHRTAGIKQVRGQEERLRDFAVCHDQNRFPAKYRVYQTATPKVYRTPQQRKADQRLERQGKWVVRSMDDENMFGPELYRRSYKEAVENGWLSDYRIIALGVNDAKAYGTANKVAGKQGSALSTVQVIRGLALALVKGGATREYNSAIRSSINFLNTIKKSKQMTEVLQSTAVRRWVAERLKAIGIEDAAPVYRLRHLDAKSNVAQREEAKAELARATDEQPRGILNVGIFGEGTDAPSLSAVGFIEPRKSPVDVIQAVGRVMRRSPGKEIGYIFCPIVIPPKTDAERWLAASNSPDDGWQALGQILLALRAHDERIEDELSDLMEIYLPSDTEAEGAHNTVSTVVALGSENGRARYYVHEGKPGEARAVAADCAEGKARPSGALWPLNEAIPDKETAAKQADGRDPPARRPKHEPEFIVTARPAAPAAATEQVQDSGQTGAAPSPASTPPVAEVREQLVERDKPTADGTRGPINVKKTKQTARKMLNGQAGRKIANPRKRPSPEQKALDLLEKSDAEKIGIYVNLLEKSGLCRTPAARSVNLLQEAIAEAKLRLAEDELESELARHFVLGEQSQSDAADGCTIAALLLMNAAMLHQRIVAGGWLPTVNIGLDQIKSAPNAKQLARRQWNRIVRHDFRPVIEPAIEVIEAIEDTGRESGLNKAIRHIAGEAERLAEDYAELGADYAGELFNKVMGNQASDGAYFTRPAAATLLARLALDAAMPDDADWTDKATWRDCRIVDLACGSGTLLAAALTEMKRRAREQGAKNQQVAALQKVAVEDTIAGLDFNPVSLQLAAAQLTAGNTNVAYRRMGLHKMAYGLDGNTYRTAAGSLELLGQRRVIGLGNELDLGEQEVTSERLQLAQDDPTLEDAVDAALGARVVIMNPPFTNRASMGEKFDGETRKRLRGRVDGLEKTLVQNDPELDGFVSKTSIGPLFEALAEKCADATNGVVAMVRATIVLTGPAALQMRRIYAQRFHIQTLLTCHQPGNVNLSQGAGINESLIIARRHDPADGTSPPTRIISLDRLPADDQEVAELHDHLARCERGLLPDNWGEVSEWPVERIEAGDWTAGVFRAPVLAEAAFQLANHKSLLRMEDQNLVPSAVLDGGAQMRVFGKADPDEPSVFPVLYYKSADAQQAIRGVPDQYWAPKKSVPRRKWVNVPGADGPQHPDTARLIKNHASHLLLTAGQNTCTGRMTAVAQKERCLGMGWMPVPTVTLEEAKAAAVFLNSTAGRLQLLCIPGKTLAYPKYRPAGLKTIRLPDLSDTDVVDRLARCWEATADTLVPQYRDGECEVRRLWDEAVCAALGWDAEWMDGLRRLLHREPHVCGVGRGEVVDAE
ncbi:MAG: hypothetical protein F4Y02_04010, partial [Chloroflexi bacterium]|nr:hypothetical protein [Chloroflexota bacterium]